MARLLYLDNNATTRVAPEVVEAMMPWLRDEYGNPSSVYPLGQRAAAALDEARGQVAALAGCDPAELVFTGCGTESINTAIQSCLHLDPDRRHIVTSVVEHSATIKLCEFLAQRGYEITWLRVDGRGRLDLNELDAAIHEETALVSLLWANNETGVLFPVEDIARLTSRKNVPLHLDAVQVAGKLPIRFNELGAQFLSLSGHKIHSPKGVGALVADRRVRFTPLLRGSQEATRRAGTQNVAGIVGFGVAATRAAEPGCAERVRALRDRFERELTRKIPGLAINGDRENRLPNTSNLTFEGVHGEKVMEFLAARGLCCSAGSACSAASIHPSHVLRAMGFSDERARSSLRFSLGRFNTEEDVDEACSLISQAVAHLRGAERATGTPMPS